MAFATKVHEEKHYFEVNGKKYLLVAHTTKFAGYHLSTHLTCYQRHEDTIDGYEYKSTRDFAMNLRSDYSGRITQKMITNHLEELRNNLNSIWQQIHAFYA